MKKLFFLLAVAFSLSTQAQSTKGFDKFWEKFQPLLVAKKYAVLSAHVQFPLKGYGSLDGAKVLTYTKANFGKALTAFLNIDDANHNPDNKTDANGDYITIKKSEVLGLYASWSLIPDNAKYVSGTSARVDDLEFKFVGGKWKLSGFYDGRTD